MQALDNKKDTLIEYNLPTPHADRSAWISFFRYTLNRRSLLLSEQDEFHLAACLTRLLIDYCAICLRPKKIRLSPHAERLAIQRLPVIAASFADIYGCCGLTLHQASETALADASPSEFINYAAALARFNLRPSSAAVGWFYVIHPRLKDDLVSVLKPAELHRIKL